MKSYFVKLEELMGVRAIIPFSLPLQKWFVWFIPKEDCWEHLSGTGNSQGVAFWFLIFLWMEKMTIRESQLRRGLQSCTKYSLLYLLNPLVKLWLHIVSLYTLHIHMSKITVCRRDQTIIHVCTLTVLSLIQFHLLPLIFSPKCYV